MRVFLTGATGFIGSRIVPELLQAGHQVLGLTRSDDGARRLSEAGATPHRGTLEDPDSLRRGAEQADGVIHCAFDHDFSNFVANCEKDGRAIAAMGTALKGSDRPLLITSGTGVGSAGPGKPAVEDIFDTSHPNPRIGSELAGQALLEQGVNVSAMRLPQVHDTAKQGLITPLVEIARQKGLVAYVGEGNNRYPAAHVTDVARLYRLALERGEQGARYNAVAEEGVSVRADLDGSRQRPEPAGQVHLAGGGEGPFRVDGLVRRHGSVGVGREDASQARLASHRPRLDRGSRADGLRDGRSLNSACSDATTLARLRAIPFGSIGRSDRAHGLSRKPAGAAFASPGDDRPSRLSSARSSAARQAGSKAVPTSARMTPRAFSTGIAAR